MDADDEAGAQWTLGTHDEPLPVAEFDGLVLTDSADLDVRRTSRPRLLSLVLRCAYDEIVIPVVVGPLFCAGFWIGALQDVTATRAPSW